MSNISYSKLSAILDSTTDTDKLSTILQYFGVADMSKAVWPAPTGEHEARIKQRVENLFVEEAIESMQSGIAPDEIEKRINHAYFVVSSYLLDKRLITPLVILWAAGRMALKGMEPGLCFTQVLHYMYNGEGVDKCKYDLKYSFRDKDVLRAFEAIKDKDLLDPIVKQDFLLSIKQILIYLKNNDRDFRKELTLTQVEKML